jgi:hypothetical protein
MEVNGHDHFASLRYHSSNNVLDFEDPAEQFDFHNILIAPGVTPNKLQNPGVAMFEVTPEGVPTNLKYEFIDMMDFGDQESISYDDLKFLSLDFANDLGVTDLTAKDLATFRKTLEDEDNFDWALTYLVRQMGFDPSVSAEYDAAMDIYKDKDLVSAKKLKIGEFLCQMHKSLTSDEFDDCCKSANNLASLFLQ